MHLLITNVNYDQNQNQNLSTSYISQWNKWRTRRLRKLLDQKGSRMMAPPGRQAIFSLVWPWPSTPDPWPFHALRSFVPIGINSGSFVFTSLVTDERADGRTNEQTYRLRTLCLQVRLARA